MYNIIIVWSICTLLYTPILIGQPEHAAQTSADYITSLSDSLVCKVVDNGKAGV